MRLDSQGRWHGDPQLGLKSSSDGGSGSSSGGGGGGGHSWGEDQDQEEEEEDGKEWEEQEEVPVQEVESEQPQRDSRLPRVASASVAPRPLYARVNHRTSAGRGHKRQLHHRHQRLDSGDITDDHQAFAALAVGSVLQGPPDDSAAPDQGDAGPAATAAAAGRCLAVAELTQDPDRNHFRINSSSDHFVAVSDIFVLKRSRDCSGKRVNVSVSVAPIVDVQHVMENSYISIVIGKVFPGETLYICQQSGRVAYQDSAVCLAEVSWPAPSFVAPSQIFSKLPEIGFLTSLREYHYKVDQLEDPLMYLTEWAVISSGTILVLSLIYALHFALTAEPLDPPPGLHGLHCPPILTRVLSYTFLMATYLTGVQSLVALSTRAIAPHIQAWVVEAVLLSGLFVGVLGLVWLTRISCIVQINETATMYGHSVVPLPSRLVLPIFDFVVMTTFIIFLGLLAVSFYTLAELDMAEFCGCLSGLLGIVKVFNTVFEQRRRRKDTLCQISLDKLAESVDCLKQGKEEVYPGEMNLLEVLSKSKQVGLTMDQVCVACRSGEDPFARAQQLEEGEELEKGTDFSLADLRWHAKFIHTKTGSKASVLTIPFACGLLFVMLLQFTRTTYQCKTLAPNLTALRTAVGTLVPDFSPETKEYILLHDRSVSTFAFLTEATRDVAKRKDFSWGNFTDRRDAADPLNTVELSGMTTMFPFRMAVEVLGGYQGSDGEWGRKEEYRVTFAEVSRLIVSMSLSRGNWSRCIYWGNLRHKIVGMPSFKDDKNLTLDIELSTVDYIPTIPFTAEQWNDHVKRGYRGSGTVFEKASRNDQKACNRLCRKLSHCLLTHVTETGCFHAMYVGQEGSECSVDRSFSSANVDGSPLDKLAKQSQVSGHLCAGWTQSLATCRGPSVSVAGSGHFRFGNIKANSPSNTFSFIGGLQRQGVPHPLAVQSHRITIHRGSPAPDSCFLAMSEGVLFQKRVIQQGFEIVLGTLDVGAVFNGSLQLKMLSILALDDDSDFEVANPSNVLEWDGNKDGWGTGNCKSKVSPHYRLWICSGHETNESVPEQEIRSSAVWDIELFDLASSSMVLTVRPKATSPLNGLADPSNKSIIYSGTPLLWAMQENCTLYGKGTFAQLTRSINRKVLWAGLEKCGNTTIDVHFRFVPKANARERYFHTTLEYRSFLAMALRKEPATDERIRYLAVAAKANKAAVKDLIYPLPTGDGFELNEKYQDEVDLSCYIEQELYTAVRFNWNDLIYNANSHEIADILCEDGGDSVAMAAPNFFANLVNNRADEDGVVRHSEGSSPVVAAVKSKYTKFLRKLLELYPEVAGRRVELMEEERWKRFAFVESKRPETLLGTIEYSFLFDCPECVEIVATAVSVVSLRCTVGTPDQGRWAADPCEHFFQRMGRLSLGRAGLGTEAKLQDLRSALNQLTAKKVAVSSLELQGNGLTNEGLALLSDAFSQLTTIRELDLSENSLDFCQPDAEAGMLRTLQSFKSLESLRLQGNKLCQRGHSELVSSYAFMPKLKNLDISRTRMGECDPDLLESASRKLTAIRQLNVSSNGLGVRLLSKLLKEGSVQTGLQSLSIMDVHLQAQDIEALGKMISPLESLIVLQMGANCLGDEGMPMLGAALSSLKQLRSLDLQQICMTGSGLLKLAQAAGRLTLQDLVLKNNLLGKGTVEVVANHFAPSPPPSDVHDASKEMVYLKLLDLGNTSLQEDLPALVAAFGKDQPLSHLTTLNLRDADGFGGSNLTALFAAIGAAGKMEFLSVPRKRQDEQQPLAGIAELAKLDALKYLDLSGQSLQGPQMYKLLGRPDTIQLDSLVLRDCAFPQSYGFQWISNVPGLSVLDLTGSALSRDNIRRIFSEILHGKGLLKELSLVGVHFYSEDLPATEVGQSHWLTYLVGDFTECDLQKLGRILPRAALHTTLRQDDEEE